jgi:hypothetical protein
LGMLVMMALPVLSVLALVKARPGGSSPVVQPVGELPRMP